MSEEGQAVWTSRGLDRCRATGFWSTQPEQDGQNPAVGRWFMLAVGAYPPQLVQVFDHPPTVGIAPAKPLERM